MGDSNATLGVECAHPTGWHVSGEWGIRTPEGLHPTRFPSVRHRPLGESSLRSRRPSSLAHARRTWRIPPMRREARFAPRPYYRPVGTSATTNTGILNHRLLGQFRRTRAQALQLLGHGRGQQLQIVQSPDPRRGTHSLNSHASSLSGASPTLPHRHGPAGPAATSSHQRPPAATSSQLALAARLA